MTALNVQLNPGEAVLTITYNGQLGDMPSPVPQNASNEDILAWTTEAVRSGSVPGIQRTPTASFAGFIIERIAPCDERPFPVIMVRPKTEYGLLTS